MGYVIMLGSCVVWGLILAAVPAAVLIVLTEHYRPAWAWRVLGWALVAALALTPLVLGVRALWR